MEPFVKRRVLVCVCALGLLAGLRVDARRQPRPRRRHGRRLELRRTSRAREGFAAGQQMPAGPLVLGAYGFMWAVVLVYVFLLSRRLQAVQKDIDALKRQTRNSAAMDGMGAAHLIFIPSVLMVGVVIGWVLGPAPPAMPTPPSSSAARKGSSATRPG